MMKTMEINSKIIKNYSNFFISTCIQNGIPINLVSQHLDEYHAQISLKTDLSDEILQNLFIKYLPEEIFKLFDQKAMITGKKIENVLFENM